MKSVLITLLTICLCQSLMSDDVAKKFFENTKTKAEKGDAVAQYTLGRLYEQGRGVEKNDKEAV